MTLGYCWDCDYLVYERDVGRWDCCLAYKEIYDVDDCPESIEFNI